MGVSQASCRRQSHCLAQKRSRRLGIRVCDLPTTSVCWLIWRFCTSQRWSCQDEFQEHFACVCSDTRLLTSGISCPKGRLGDANQQKTSSVTSTCVVNRDL